MLPHSSPSGYLLTEATPLTFCPRLGTLNPQGAKRQKRTTSTTFLKFRIYHSSRGTDFVGPGVDDGIAVEVVDEGHQSFAEFAF
jgi:hypothetical protein